MIEFYPDKSNKWRARITAANGEIIFSSHQGFSSRQRCKANLRLVHRAISGWDCAGWIYKGGDNE